MAILRELLANGLMLLAGIAFFIVLPVWLIKSLFRTQRFYGRLVFGLLLGLFLAVVGLLVVILLGFFEGAGSAFSQENMNSAFLAVD